MRYNIDSGTSPESVSILPVARMPVDELDFETFNSRVLGKFQGTEMSRSAAAGIP